MKRLVSISLLLCIVTLIACSRKETPQPAMEGKAAPDFTVRDLAGKETRLSDLKGKVALVNFWATWCPPCREEVPSMAELNRLMAGKPFQMLAISIDEGGKEAVEAFFRQANTSLPAYLDSNGTIGKMYGITGVPETFVIDRNGVIIKKLIGPLDWTAPEVVKFLNEAMQ
jgi:thiol-disulfide isomerase/thioredoxin